MNRLLEAATSYPTAVYSALLAVVLIYWLLAVIGWVDFESMDIDMELETHADGDAADLTSLAGFLMAMGLNGVPFSIVVSLLVLVAWTLSALAGEWLMPLVPTALLQVVIGTGVLIACGAIAIPVVARLIRPMRGLFVVHNATGNASLVGMRCRIVSETADDRFGRAEVQKTGANPQIRVHTVAGKSLKKGEAAIVVEYDAATQRYLVEPETG